MKKWNMGITGQLRLLMFSVGMVSLIVLSYVSFVGVYDLRTDAMESGRRIAESTVSFIESLGKKQAREHLLNIAVREAQSVEREIYGVRLEVHSLADMASRMLSHPETYVPRRLPDPMKSVVRYDEPYITYAPEVQQSGIHPELAYEAGILSNIADIMDISGRHYRGYTAVFFVAMENGYTISVSTSDSERAMEEAPEGFLTPNDPRTRVWYTNARNHQRFTVSDVYSSTSGYSAIMCSEPIYVNGEFVGVAGFKIKLSSVVDWMQKTVKEDLGSGFAINGNGTVVLSSMTQGTLAVSEDGWDIRKAADPSLSKTAAAMTEGASGSSLVTVDGVEYYLAYAPMPSIGWSYGALISKDDVLYASRYAREKLQGSSETFVDSIYDFYQEHLLHMVLFFLPLSAAMFLVGGKVSQRFVRPLFVLAAGVREIAKGDLDKKIQVKTGDEIEELADSVNHMTGGLKAYMENIAKITAEKERMSLKMARAERELFVNKLLHYSMSGENPGKTLSQMVKYLGGSLGGHRAYIFEATGGGVFELAYEWRAEGGMHAPALFCSDMMNMFYEEHKKSRNVIFRDSKECRELGETVYQAFQDHGIRSLVTAPLFIDGEYAGFFGVNDLPPEKIDELVQRLELTAYFISAVLRQKRYLAEEAARIEGELDNARRIQASMLPSDFAHFSRGGEVDVYAAMTPAKEVAGDFYDIYRLDGGHIAFTIADVSGNGIPAALFMVRSKTTLKNHVRMAVRNTVNVDCVDWARVIERVNRELWESNREQMIATLFFGVLDTVTGSFSYVNVGHNAPLLGRRSKATGAWDYTPVDKRGMVLGVRPKETYEMERLTLGQGDVMFLYTDGVTEAVDEQENLYGEERLREILNRTDITAHTAKDLLTAVYADVREHVGNEEQFDDITMMGIRFLGKSQG